MSSTQTHSRREANQSTLKRLNEGAASGPAVGELSGPTKLKSSSHIIKNGHPSNSAAFTSKTTVLSSEADAPLPGSHRLPSHCAPEGSA